MKMAPRERNLLFATLVVGLLAATWAFLAPQRLEWKDYQDRREDLEDRLAKAERMLGQKGDVEARLAEFRKGVPVFAEGKRAESELLPEVDRMASRHGLALVRRSASDKEREAGDLYETTLTCEWEGTLEALVHFLYDQQSQGVVSDIRQLRIQPQSGAKLGTLKGGFEMDCAYRRGEAAAAVEPAAEEAAE
jgi:hypothetical protein